MHWRAWYADGSTREGKTRPAWKRAKKRQVVGVASRLSHDEYGRPLGAYAAGGDWYWWTSSGIDSGASHPTPGVNIDYDGPPDGRGDAKSGEWVSDEVYAEVYSQMREWVNG